MEEVEVGYVYSKQWLITAADAKGRLARHFKHGIVHTRSRLFASTS
jgi:hypothetical protein